MKTVKEQIDEIISYPGCTYWSDELKIKKLIEAMGKLAEEIDLINKE